MSRAQIENRTWSARGGERGQAFVEFALVITVTLVLMFTAVDFGRAYTCWVQATNAAREGARLATAGAGATEAAARSQTAAGTCQGAAAGAATVDIASGDSKATLAPTQNVCSSASSGSVQWVQVQQNYTLPLLTPIGGMVRLLSGSTWGSTFTITGSSCMRLS